MNCNRSHWMLLVSGCVVTSLFAASAAGVELRQVISREHPAIKATG